MSRESHKSWRASQVTSIVIPSRSVFTINSGATTAKLYLFLLVLFPCIFTGCLDNTVQSLNPFCTEEAVVELSQLEGEWLSFIALDNDTVSQMNMKPWILEENTVKIFDEDKKVSVARIKFFQIEDSYFADIVMANFNLDLFDDVNDDMIDSDMDFITNSTFTFWSMFHWRPVHILYKVEIDEGNTSLVLTPLSFDWLKKIVEENPDLIPLIEGSDADSPVPLPLANAASETWMSLWKKYWNEEKAFPSDQIFKVLLKKPGKPHVLLSYKNGNPQTVVLPEDREFSDGSQARANTPIRYAESGQVINFIFNHDWQSPAGLWLKAGTLVEYFENGDLKHATLAKDWASPKGRLIKAGTILEFSKNGKIKKLFSD